MNEYLALSMLESWQIEMKKAGFVRKHRYFTLQPGEIREIQAADETYVVLFAHDGVIIRSETGIYDLFSGKTAESIFHHTGTITLENHSSTAPQDVEFLQAIWIEAVH